MRAAVLLLLCCTSLSADAAPHPLEGNAAERELLQTLRQEKLIRAREQAERILRRDASSIIARYALALAFHDEETNLPRALYHVRRAARELARRHGRAPRHPLAQSWHRKLLEEEEDLLGEMDRREEQLTVLDRHDALYHPKLDRRRIWPLMKLGRFAEAKRLAERVARSEEIVQRASGLNGLIAIESEQHRPRECFAAGQRAIAATGGRSCILLQNTAEAAFAVYRFDEVERLAQRSLQAELSDCPATAHQHLANLYLLRADFQRAMAAVQAAREQGIQRRYRQQFEMTNAAWLARLLYTLGEFEQALGLCEQALRAPDRVGMTSFSAELMEVIAAVDHHAVLEARQEELLEQASVRPLGQRLRLWLTRRALDHTAWVARHRAARLLAKKDLLVHLVRPYFKPLPPWNAGALITVAGSGLLLQAIAEARQRERMPRSTEPYFQALAGEIHYRAGDLAEARAEAARARAGLPREETLLRGRVAAWDADAAFRLGQREEAAARFEEVLHRYPTALRLLGIRLPVRLLADADPLSRRVARVLRGSRRLQTGDLGFTVRVTRAGPALRLCLGGRGRQVACTEKDVSAARTDEERVIWACDAFHRKVFAPKIDLTQRDINSLDGSAVRGDADEVLREGLVR